MAQQLAQLTDRLADVLSRWSETDHKHALAVREVESRLVEWGAVENRLHQDSADRIHQLEQAIQHEWLELRQVHEEPVKQLREQAAALSEICVSAANLAVQGFERAEARINSLEANLQERLNQLSLDVHAALTEGRHATPRPALGGGVAPFPLDGVMRIHDEIRGTGALRVARSEPEPEFEPEPDRQPAADYRPQFEAAALAARVETLEREVTSERKEVRENESRAEHMRRNWRISLAALGGLIVLAGLVGWLVWRQVNARLEDAQTRVTAAQRDAQSASEAANRQLESTRADAARQIAEARQSAQNAEIVSNVLAAPDLIRYSLVGGTDAPDRPYAQVLWSRARGFVISAARLPATSGGSVYQVWLTSSTAAVSAGTFTPDTEGRATLATNTPQNVPRPVTGVIVTLEPSEGQTTPTGPTVLARGQ